MAALRLAMSAWTASWPVVDRPGASIDAVPTPSASTAERFGDALGPSVVVGKGEIFPARGPRSHLLTRSGRLALKAVEAFDDVAEETRFALLAVGDNIDPRFDLFPDNFTYRLAHAPGELFAIVGLTLFPQSKCPFTNLPEKRRTMWALTADEMKECRWLKPKLVAQIEFTEWTPDGHLRHSSFVGLRDDKEARRIVRE
jgi:ATP dependent DNA ligase-like protein